MLYIKSAYLACYICGVWCSLMRKIFIPDSLSTFSTKVLIYFVPEIVEKAPVVVHLSVPNLKVSSFLMAALNRKMPGYTIKEFPVFTLMLLVGFELNSVCN